MFHSARIRFTIWYTLIILLITTTISSLFYIRTVVVFERNIERIEERLQKDFPGRMLVIHENVHLPTRLIPRDSSEFKRDLIMQLVGVNSVIMVIVASSSYFLSGLTLQPIQRAHEEQKRFVSDAAHELKTPITALKTSLEVNLMDKKLDVYGKSILKENLEDVSGLEKLTESLLKLARVNGSGLSRKNVNLSHVISEAVKYMSPLAKKKHITVKTNGLKNSAIIRGDEGSLLDLLIIFLDNAIKYSEKNSTVIISLVQDDKQVFLSVTDEGIGISAEHIDKIFDRFYRADQSRSKGSASGYGLGLSVAQKIIIQHNGRVSVNSTVKKGTTFTSTFPLSTSS